MDEYELVTSGRYGPKPRWIGDKERISDYADNHPETLAGWWIEHEGQSRNGGRQAPPVSPFVIAFTRDIEGHSEALCALLFAPEKVKVIQMRYTYRHLLDIAKQIPAILGVDMDGVTGWGPDTKKNVVKVGVLPERLDAVRDILMNTNPDDVRVVPGSPAVAT